MSEKNEKDLTGIDNVEVEPLTDEDLESVAGGNFSPNDTVNNATTGCGSNAANACC